MLFRLRGIGYFLNIKTESYTQACVLLCYPRWEGLVIFLICKPSLTRNRALNYAIHAERDWLFFDNQNRVLHASVRVIMLSSLEGIGYFF